MPKNTDETPIETIENQSAPLSQKEAIVVELEQFANQLGSWAHSELSKIINKLKAL